LPDQKKTESKDQNLGQDGLATIIIMHPATTLHSYEENVVAL
jgi:hypothetical protein